MQPIKQERCWRDGGEAAAFHGSRICRCLSAQDRLCGVRSWSAWHPGRTKTNQKVKRILPISCSSPILCWQISYGMTTDSLNGSTSPSCRLLQIKNDDGARSNLHLFCSFGLFQKSSNFFRSKKKSSHFSVSKMLEFQLFLAEAHCDVSLNFIRSSHEALKSCNSNWTCWNVQTQGLRRHYRLERPVYFGAS